MRRALAAAALVAALFVPLAPAASCLVEVQSAYCVGEAVALGPCTDDNVDVRVLYSGTTTSGCDTLDVGVGSSERGDGGDVVDVHLVGSETDDGGDTLDVSHDVDETNDGADSVDVTVGGSEVCDGDDGVDVESLVGKGACPAGPAENDLVHVDPGYIDVDPLPVAGPGSCLVELQAAYCVGSALGLGACNDDTVDVAFAPSSASPDGCDEVDVLVGGEETADADDTVDVTVAGKERDDASDDVDVGVAQTEGHDGGDSVDVSVFGTEGNSTTATATDQADLLDVSVFSTETKDAGDEADLTLGGSETTDDGDLVDVAAFAREQCDRLDFVDLEVYVAKPGCSASESDQFHFALGS